MATNFKAHSSGTSLVDELARLELVTEVNPLLVTDQVFGRVLDGLEGNRDVRGEVREALGLGE